MWVGCNLGSIAAGQLVFSLYTHIASSVSLTYDPVVVTLIREVQWLGTIKKKHNCEWLFLKCSRKDQRVNLKHSIVLALRLVSYKWVEWLISDHMTILNAEPTSESTSEFTSELVIKSTFDNRRVGREWLKIY